MIRKVFDLEADGLLDTITKLHCNTLIDVDTKEVQFFGPDKIDQSIEELKKADVLIGHNIIGFDLKAIKKLYGINFNDKTIIDTLVWSRVLVPEPEDTGNFNSIHKGHSLKAWGLRLGNNKADFNGPWDTYSEEMGQYNIQDVRVTLDLFELLDDLRERQNMPLEVLNAEQRVAEIIEKQVRHGFNFDREKANDLYANLLEKKFQLRESLSKLFPPLVKDEGLFVPKVSRNNYVSNVPLTRVRFIPFNPTSRNQIIENFKKRYNWISPEKTKNDNEALSNEILESLDFSEAKALSPLFTVEKRIAQLATGKSAWINLVNESTNKIHGVVNTNGAITARMTHYSPNMTQVPANDKLYGKECRELFKPSAGKVLVGVDAVSLEARCLAGYLARYDDGDYVRKVECGIDLHQENATLAGIERNEAKTVYYALIYGAGDKKIGKSLGVINEEEQKSLGKLVRNKLLKAIPALDYLIKSTQLSFNERGYLLALDGRRIYPRKEYSALNTLLQSAGAIIMKRALIICYQKFKELDEMPMFVNNIHDEWQIECTPEIADKVGQIAAQSIVAAGEYYNFPCKMAGEYKIGKNWSETH